MKKHFIGFILIFISTQIYAQLKFEKGYVINNKGVKKECLLFNTGKEMDGSAFIYKYNKKGESKSITVDSIKEFGIQEAVKYVRSEINIDVSEDVLTHVRDTLNHVEMEKGHAFLYQLVDSEIASLYYFSYGGKEYYFGEKENTAIENLVYKKYKVVDNRGEVVQTLYDRTYKDQLAVYFPCSIEKKSISYTKNSLIKYFNTYINEQGKEVNNYKSQSKGVFHFKIAGMLNQNSFHVVRSEILPLFKFENTSTLGYGLEFEYLLRFNRNKIGLFGELNYGEYESLMEENGSVSQVSEINYKSLEFPIGVSYNFNISKEFKFFLKAAVVPCIVLEDSNFYLYNEINTVELRNPMSFLFGFGVNFKRFNLEYRIYSEEDIAGSAESSRTKETLFKKSALKISYTFLSLKRK